MQTTLFKTEEKWKPIPNHENYEASTKGRIRNRKTCKILKENKNTNGYKQIVINYITHQIHTLIAITYLNHKPCGHKIIVDHINEIKTDNRLKNLQLLTNRQNLIKAKKATGTSWSKNKNKWQTEIRFNKNKISLGRYKTKKHAELHYKIALTIIEKITLTNKEKIKLLKYNRPELKQLIIKNYEKLKTQF